MKKIKYSVLKNIALLYIFSLSFVSAQSNADELYIAKFAKIAVEEMHIYKIPASITLAQGLLETAYGQSELAQNANNHFGIKCKKEWQGETYRYTDDAYMECFRKYASAWESYRDHSKFLAERPYYKALFNLPMTDYKAWAHGLKKAGYATNPKYAQLLISRIEKYNLNQFDHITVEEVDAKLAQLYPSVSIDIASVKEVTPSLSTPPKLLKKEPVTEVTNVPVSSSSTSKNDKILKEPKPVVHPLERVKNHKNSNLPYIEIQQGETLYQISKNYKTSVKKLQRINDIKNPEQIRTGTFIFFKNKKSKGRTKIYVAEANETMHSISQKEAIKLEKLLQRNNLSADYITQEGDVIYLKGKKK